jgi:hypothetical protein
VAFKAQALARASDLFTMSKIDRQSGDKSIKGMDFPSG